MEPPPDAYLRLARKCHSFPLKVKLILQAFHARERQQGDERNRPSAPGDHLAPTVPATSASDAPSFAAQQVCLRCRVHRAQAQRPFIYSDKGWTCGFCAMQLALLAEPQPEPTGEPLSTELRAALLSLPDSNLTRQRLLPALLAQSMEQDGRLPRVVFPGKMEVRTSTESAVHAALSREPATARQLAEATGLARSTIYDTLASLAAGGWIGHTGMGTKQDPHLYYKIK